MYKRQDKDGVAIINAAQENGIKIPEEMEVVGMLNTSYSIMCKPTLSSLNAVSYTHLRKIYPSI